MKDINKNLFKGINKIIADLTKEEKLSLLNRLKADVLGGISKDVVSCPCCSDSNFKKDGNYKGVQKYKCRTTSKIFTYKSNSIISRVRDLDLFESLMDLMVGDKFPRLDDIEQKLGVSRKTAHDWRAKIMTSVFKHVKFDNQVIEFDETNFRLSRKGRQGMTYSRKRGKKLVGESKYNVKVFMTYSRTTGKLELFQSHMGRTSANDLDNHLGLNKGMVVYSDSHSAYISFFEKRNVMNGTFISKNHISLLDKEVHNQTVNYYTKRLKNFIDKELMGVSTKYLQGYLNWIMYIENAKKESVSIKDVVMENKVALDIFKQKEKEFQYFLKVNGRNNYGTCRDRYYGNVA